MKMIGNWLMRTREQTMLEYCVDLIVYALAGQFIVSKIIKK